MRTASYLNNDCHGQDLILRKRRLIAVMDGVSDSDGKRAAKTVADELAKAATAPKGKYASISEVILAAHERLLSSDALTTAVVADFSARKIYHVGDSLAYYFQAADETIYELTTPDRHPIEINVVTQAIGVDTIIVHENELPVEPGFLILMSDGVSDNLPPERLLACCTGTRSPRTVVNRVVRLLLKRQRREKGFEYEDFKDDDRALVVVRI